MLLMTDAALAAIEERALRFTDYGDRDALSTEDVADLLADLHECRANFRAQVVRNRQLHDQLRAAEDQLAMREATAIVQVITKPSAGPGPMCRCGDALIEHRGTGHGACNATGCRCLRWSPSAVNGAAPR